MVFRHASGALQASEGAFLICQISCCACEGAWFIPRKRAVRRQEIEKILRCLPAKEGRQNVMFSATYPSNIQELASFALKPQRQLVDTVGEEQTHAAEQVGGLPMRPC